MKTEKQIWIARLNERYNPTGRKRIIRISRKFHVDLRTGEALSYGYYDLLREKDGKLYVFMSDYSHTTKKHVRQLIRFMGINGQEVRCIYSDLEFLAKRHKTRYFGTIEAIKFSAEFYGPGYIPALEDTLCLLYLEESIRRQERKDRKSPLLRLIS